MCTYLLIDERDEAVAEQSSVISFTVCNAWVEEQEHIMKSISKDVQKH